MEMTDAKVVEKKIYEEGKKHDEYASKGIAGTGLGLGIAGTALGLGAWLLGGNRNVFDLLKDKDGVYDIREYFLK